MGLHFMKRASNKAVALLALCASASFAGTLSNVTVAPADDTAGATTTYTFFYTTETAVNGNQALFYVTFPNGFSVGAGACDRIVSLSLNPDPVDPMNFGQASASCLESYGSGNTVAFAVNTSNGDGIDVPENTEVTVVVKDVTNPATAGDYDFDPTNGIVSGTGIYTAQMAVPSSPVEIDKAPKKTVTITDGSAVNGACGTANGKVFSFEMPPQSNLAGLCASGDWADYREDQTKFIWTCNGKNGGTNTAADACSATIGNNLVVSVYPPDSGSATCIPNPVIVGESSMCSYTAAPGFSFDFWSGDCAGVICAPNNVTQRMIISAEFKVSTYDIAATISPSTAGTVSCTSNSVAHGDNSSCSYVANPGYTFINWTGDCTGATCDLVGVTAAKSVTANFSAPTFAITTAVSPSGAGTANCTPNPVNGGSSATCAASANTGYSFTGWSGDCTGGTCALIAVGTAKSVTANFALNSYSISGAASPDAGGVVSCSGSVTHGSNGNCTATANAGYTFSGWSSCASASGTTCSFTNVTASQSVTANFTVNSYTLTATANPTVGGSATCTGPVNHGASASCTANAAAGYRLANWSGACTGSSCAIASVTANSSVTANFELLPIYNVATQVTPADSGKITCTQGIVEGSSGTCTAKASSGYRFKAWGGDCSGTEASCTLANVSSAKSVTATFEEAKSFVISAVQQKPKGQTNRLDVVSDSVTRPILELYISCSESGPVSAGTSVTCSPKYLWDNGPVGDGIFRGWAGDCSRVEGEKCIIENISNDKQLILKTGFVSSSVKIQPTGAGRVWCDYFDPHGFTSIESFNHDCITEPNAGYAFESLVFDKCSDLACLSFRKSTATFTKQANSPAVICEDCSSSETTTDTETTKTASKTSEPDEQGTSTQSTVSTTTNNTGDTTTSVTVGTEKSDGQSQTGGTFTSNDPNAQVIVNNGNTVTATSNNTQAGTTATTTVSPTGTSNVVVFSDDTSNEILHLATGQSQTVELDNVSEQTTFTVSDSSGVFLGKTTVNDGQVTTQSSTKGVLTSVTPSSTTYSDDRITTVAPVGNQNIALTILYGDSAPSTLVVSPAKSEPVEFTGSGASVTFCIGDCSGSPYVSYAQYITENEASPPGPILSKQSAEDDNREVFVDVAGGAFQSIQLSSSSSGLVEFFKSDTSANDPQITKLDMTSESANLTLTYPAAK